MSSHYAAQAGLELSHPSASCLLSNRSKGMSCHNLCLMSFPLDHPVATGSYIPGHVSVIASCFQYCHQNTANCASEKGTVAVAYFRFPGLSLLVIKKKKRICGFFIFSTGHRPMAQSCLGPTWASPSCPHSGTIYVFLPQSLTICETRSFPICPQHRQCYTVATKVQWWPSSGLWINAECYFLHLEHCLLLAMLAKPPFPVCACSSAPSNVSSAKWLSSSYSVSPHGFFYYSVSLKRHYIPVICCNMFLYLDSRCLFSKLLLRYQLCLVLFACF